MAKKKNMFVVFSSDNEILITSLKNEKKFLKENFGSEIGRLVCDDTKEVNKKYRADELDTCTIYSREEIKDVVCISSSLRVE